VANFNMSASGSMRQAWRDAHERKDAGASAFLLSIDRQTTDTQVRGGRVAMLFSSLLLPPPLSSCCRDPHLIFFGTCDRSRWLGVIGPEDRWWTSVRDRMPPGCL
jgi:hypothetical protein